jgi:hypothetical protein
VDIVTSAVTTEEVAPRLEKKFGIIPMVIRRELSARKKNMQQETLVDVLTAKKRVITKRLA